MNFTIDSSLLDFPAAESRYSFAADRIGNESFWEKARIQVLAIAQLEPNWDGEGALKIATPIVASALHLLSVLQAKGYPAPNDVYPLVEGTIVVEWQFPDDVIMRIEVDGSGRGEKMVSYPEAPCQFDRIAWGTTTLTPWVLHSQKLWLLRGCATSALSIDLGQRSEDNLPTAHVGCELFHMAA